MGMGGGFQSSFGTISITMSLVDRLTGKLARIGAGLQGVNSTVASVAQGLRSAGTAIIGVMSLAVSQVQSATQEVKPLISSLARLQAVTKSNVLSTQEWLDQGTRIANKLGVPIQQVTQGFWQVASAGARSKESIQEVTMAAGRLSRMFDTTVRDAIDISLRTARGFGIELQNVEAVTSTFNKAISGSLLTLQDLGNTMEYVAPVAGAAGMGIEDITAAIMAMADQGVKGCYDEKTEVLTDSGFKKFRNVDIENDKVMTVDINNDNNMEWQEPVNYFEYFVDEDMYKVKNQYLDLKVTKNHRMVNKSRYSDGKYEIRSAEDSYQKNLKYLTSGKWEGKEPEYFRLEGTEGSKYNKKSEPIKINIEDWLEFFGYYITEGHTNYDGKGTYKTVITQRDGTKKNEKIRKCIERLPFNYDYTKSTGQFRIHSKQLYEYLSQFGVSHEKYIPEEMKELSPRLLKILYESLKLGDGDEQGNLYTSSNKLKDDYVEIILKIGWKPTAKIKNPRGSITNIKGREIETEHDHWIVNVSKKQGREPIFYYKEYKKWHPDHYNGWGETNVEKWEHYTGKVYDVEVPNGTLIVRRNGKTCVSGNSKAGTALRTAISRLAAPTAKAQEWIRKLGVQFFEQTEASAEAREAWESQMSALDSLQREYRRMEEQVKELSQAEQEYSQQATKISHRIQAIRLKARKQDRKLNEQEMKQIEDLEEKRDILRWQAEERAIQEQELRSEMQNQQKQIDRTKKAAEEQRKAWKNNRGAMLPMVEIANRLAEAIKEQGFSAQQTLSMLKDLIGRRGLSGFTALMNRTEAGLNLGSNAMVKFGHTAEGGRKDIGELRQMLGGTVATVKETGRATENTREMWSSYTDVMAPYMKIQEAVNARLKNFSERMLDSGSEIVNARVQAEKLKEAMQDASTSMVDFASSIPGGLMTTFGSAIGMTLVPAIVGLGNTIATKVNWGKLASGASKAVSSLRGTIVPGLKSVGSSIASSASGWASSMGSSLSSGVSSIMGSMMPFGLAAMGVAMGAILIYKYREEIWNALKKLGGWLKKQFGKVLNVIIDVINGIIGWIKNNWTDILLKIIFPPYLIASIINDVFPGLFDAIINGFMNIFNSVIDWIKNNWVDILLTIIFPPYLIGKLINTLFPGFVDDIIDTFTSLPGQILDLAKKIPKMIWEGIKGMGGWLLDKVTGFVKDIIGKLNPMNWDIPGLSPIRGVGEHITEEIGKGIGQSEVKAISPTKEMVGEIQTNLKAAVPDIERTGSLARSNRTGEVRNETNVNIRVNTGDIRKESDEDRLSKKIAKQTQKGLNMR